MVKGNSLRNVVLFLVGLVITQLGVALELVSNAGSDGFTVFNQGLADTLNVSQGTANMMILFALLVVIIIFGRKNIKIGTFICLFCTGPILDMFIFILNYLNIDEGNLIIRCLAVLLASLIIAIGFSIISATKVGIAPNDIIPFIIKDKFNFQYKWIRMTLDFSYLILGFILGGVIGLGTIILALTLGPFIQFFIPLGEKLVSSFSAVKEFNN